MLSIAGTSKGSAEKAASMIARMETRSTLSLAIAVACGVSAAIRAPSFDAARTEANEPGDNPTVENERSAQHREYGESLRAHCPSPRMSGPRLTRAELDRNRTRLILGSKCGRAPTKTAGFHHFPKVLPECNSGLRSEYGGRRDLDVRTHGEEPRAARRLEPWPRTVAIPSRRGRRPLLKMRTYAWAYRVSTMKSVPLPVS